MIRFTFPLLSILVTASGVIASGPPAITAEAQAVLDRSCVKCHGPLEQEAGLRLDTAAAVMKGGEDGPVVVAGKPDDSKLLSVLARTATPHMPPKKQLADADVATLRKWVTTLSAAPAPEVKAERAQVPTEPAAAIDHFLTAAWQARGLTPAAVCDDRTFIRRVTLDLVGRIPTPEETSKFLFDAAPDKRAVLVDRLLTSDEAARNRREIWDALLMGRPGRREDRRRDSGWLAFLENSFKQNRPWDEIVRAFLAARPEDKGAVWFLYERRNDYQQIAESVAPVIYGTRLDCAQCHDHPLASEIKQGHYWGLVAAFNRGKNVERGGPTAVKESAVGGVMNFTNLKKESQPAVITLLTGKVVEEPRGANDADTPDRYIDPKAAVPVPKFSRREALAEAATRGNPLLARSFVNHTWAILMGRGIVDPPDEMNSKHPPSHPELLDWLAADFASHNYDVRRLTRAIVLSRGYQLASWAGSATPPPDAFAAAVERPLTPEAIARSARIAAGLTPDDDSLRKAVAEAFPGLPGKVSQVTMQQAMFLTNNPLMADLFKPNPADAVSAISPEDRVRGIFRRALVRDPDAEELARGVAFLKSPAEPGTAVGQLLWAIVAGPEFLTNH
ncbi:DUF1549 domain-containing protein [Limnoglobus roseus]|uniref:Cytochrome c domain-containing protein n=1 Tax=Limnoglobus roseus TaxID=2598579 RepID=A0A5C1AGI5_9BACT|nr:DUF1549 domain-containing protein [Limnoglobus roseus]QEL16224.1 hypothetical protein PX52LOC_03164 [Limnoglobus roseus]